MIFASQTLQKGRPRQPVIMKRIFSYTISSSEESQTIREYLKGRGYSHHILAQIKRTDGGIRLNGRPVPVNALLQSGDLLEITLIEQAPSEHIPAVPVPFSIVYEDEDLLIVNKPADTPIHPSFQNHENTLANGIAWYYAQKGLPFVYRCINRLDRDTSGLLIIAKHALCASILSKAMKEHTLRTASADTLENLPFSVSAAADLLQKEASGELISENPFQIHRTYLAIAEGKIDAPGTITAPIGRKEGSVLERCVDFEKGEPAVTHYQPVHYRKDLDLSLISLRLETGRTHQIRVHMGYLGHPLIGDYLYYPRKDLIQRQALHSWQLDFLHPITKERLNFQAPLPKDMRFILS